jgi:hypothetical protein
MLLLEGYISDFTCPRYYFLYVEFSDFYVINLSLDKLYLLAHEYDCGISSQAL